MIDASSQTGSAPLASSIRNVLPVREFRNVDSPTSTTYIGVIGLGEELVTSAVQFMVTGNPLQVYQWFYLGHLTEVREYIFREGVHQRE